MTEVMWWVRLGFGKWCPTYPLCNAQVKKEMLSDYLRQELYSPSISMAAALHYGDSIQPDSDLIISIAPEISFSLYVLSAAISNMFSIIY